MWMESLGKMMGPISGSRGHGLGVSKVTLTCKRLLCSLDWQCAPLHP